MAFLRRPRDYVPPDDRPSYADDGVLTGAIAILVIVMITVGVLCYHSRSAPALRPAIENTTVPRS